MGKVRPICVHCVKAEGVTDDHGIPLSWYPEGSAQNVARVKAPACCACNARLKHIEEEVLIPLIFSIDPRDPRAASVAERVRRSMDPALGRDERDSRARAAKSRRVAAAVFIPESRVGVFPGLGAKGRGAAALKLRASAIQEFAEKLTRVVLYARYRQYVAAGRTVATHIVEHGPQETRIAELIRGGERIDIPPGVFVAIRRAEDDADTVLAVVDLWGHVRVFASITPPDVSPTTTK